MFKLVFLNPSPYFSIRCFITTFVIKRQCPMAYYNIRSFDCNFRAPRPLYKFVSDSLCFLFTASNVSLTMPPSYN